MAEWEKEILTLRISRRDIDGMLSLIKLGIYQRFCRLHRLAPGIRSERTTPVTQ